MPRRTDQLNRWRDHLADYRVKHPNLSLKQCMIGASKTYQRSTTTKKKKVQGKGFEDIVKYAIHGNPVEDLLGILKKGSKLSIR